MPVVVLPDGLRLAGVAVAARVAGVDGVSGSGEALRDWLPEGGEKAGGVVEENGRAAVAPAQVVEAEAVEAGEVGGGLHLSAWLRDIPVGRLDSSGFPRNRWDQRLVKLTHPRRA